MGVLPAKFQDLIDLQRARLELLKGQSVKDMLRLVEQSQRDVDKRLRAMRRGLGDEAFSTVHLQVLQTQLREAASTLNTMLTGSISKKTTEARLSAGEDVWNQAAWWDQAKEFKGIEHVRIPLEQVEAMLREESLVRAYERLRVTTGVRRYTNQALEDVERLMGISLLSQDTVDQAVTRLRGASPFLEKAWQAERLVRTETSYAYNQGAVESIEEVAADDDGLWQEWYEFAEGPQWAGPKDLPWPGEATPGDDRVANDSLRMHGQLRRPGQLFIDPLTKKTVDHPPNRPNDRATVIMVRVDDGEGVSRTARKGEKADKYASQATHGGVMDAPFVEELPDLNGRDLTAMSVPYRRSSRRKKPPSIVPPGPVATAYQDHVASLVANGQSRASAGVDWTLRSIADGEWDEWRNLILLRPGVRRALDSIVSDSLSDTQLTAGITAEHEIVHSTSKMVISRRLPWKLYFVPDMLTEFAARQGVWDLLRSISPFRTVTPELVAKTNTALVGGYGPEFVEFMKIPTIFGMEGSDIEQWLAVPKTVFVDFVTEEFCKLLAQQAHLSPSEGRDLLDKMLKVEYNKKEQEKLNDWLKRMVARKQGRSRPH